MPETPKIFGTKYKYEQCMLCDVGPHFDKIREWIPDEEYIEFNERMMNCVEEGTAWRTKNTFIYYEMQNKRISYGVALFGKEHAAELMALFIGVFGHEDKTTSVMRFKLHPGKMMEEYKAMLTEISIKRTHANPNHALMVRIDELRKKFINGFLVKKK